MRACGWRVLPSAAQKSGHSSNSGGGSGDTTSNGNQPQPEQNRKKGKLKEIFSGDFGTEPALSFVCIYSAPQFKNHTATTTTYHPCEERFPLPLPQKKAPFSVDDYSLILIPNLFSLCCRWRCRAFVVCSSN